MDVTQATFLLFLATSALALLALLQFIQTRQTIGESRRHTELLGRQTQVLRDQAAAAKVTAEEMHAQRVAAEPLTVEVIAKGTPKSSWLLIENASDDRVALIDRVLVRRTDPAQEEALIDLQVPVTLAVGAKYVIGEVHHEESDMQEFLVEVYGRPAGGPDQRRDFWLETASGRPLTRMDQPRLPDPAVW
jgi:hypothetical protein